MIEISVSQRFDKPIYEQIYTQIVSQIVNGNAKEDEALPSIRGVALDLNISVITVKNAYDKLEADGYIYTRAGKGSFVAPQKSVGVKRDELARLKLREELPYYKLMGIEKEEFISVASEVWDEVAARNDDESGANDKK